MRMVSQILFTLIACLLLNISSTADIYSDLNKCIDIQNSIDRLYCFDTMSKAYKLQTKDVSSTIPDENTQLNTPVSAQIDKKVKIETIAIKQQEPVQSKAEGTSFGLIKESEVKSVESRLIGEFSSWEKGMKLRLENGQVWKVTKSGTGYIKVSNPKVTIKRGFMSSFNATIEGLNSKAKVKRIK